MSHIDRRKMIVDKIYHTLVKLKKEDLGLDEEKLIAILGFEEGVSRRTAVDYILSAKARLEMTKPEPELEEKDVDELLTRSE